MKTITSENSWRDIYMSLLLYIHHRLVGRTLISKQPSMKMELETRKETKQDYFPAELSSSEKERDI